MRNPDGAPLIRRHERVLVHPGLFCQALSKLEAIQPRRVGARTTLHRIQAFGLPRRSLITVAEAGRHKLPESSPRSIFYEICGSAHLALDKLLLTRLIS